jgi:predicted small lipoprotein YifL
MRNHLKITALLVSLALIMSLTACTKQGNTDAASDNKGTTPTITPTQSETNKPDAPKQQYTFINGSLLGCYENGAWHSLCDTIDTHNVNIYKAGKADTKAFYANELLNQDSYYVYDAKKQLGVSKQIIWQTEEASGLGSFEDKDAPKKFAKYGKLYSFDGSSTTSYRIFDLPQKLGDELSSLKIPDYSFSTEFVYGEKWERPRDDFRLVISSSTDPFPRPLTYDTQPTSKGKQVLADIFKDKSIENTVPNFIKMCER